ncbi:MAG: hypothetical protein IIC23_07160, partial [Chloroflexi bacterium]|nr:hypothetical protein [Chloroflexota bacterium]
MQLTPESYPRLPTVDMPENSDSLELQPIGQAASGARRMAAGVTQRHPTMSPLSATGGDMPGFAGRRGKNGPTSSIFKAASALQRAGRRIVRRAALGAGSWNATSGDYGHDQASLVWLARPADAGPADDGPDDATGGPGIQTPQKRAMPRPKAVVRRKVASPGSADKAAPSRPRRSKRPLGRTASTVIRRGLQLEAMPKVQRRSEKPIRPLLDRTIVESKPRPMASPDRWRAQEMGAPEGSRTAPASMDAMLDAPVRESRSLNLKPVARRKPETGTVDQGNAEPLQMPTPEPAQPAAPADRPASDAPIRVARSAKAGMLSRAREVVFRKSHDKPIAANESLVNAAGKTVSSQVNGPVPSTVQRESDLQNAEKTTAKPSMARRIKQMRPGRGRIANRAAQTATQAITGGTKDQDVRADYATAGPTQQSAAPSGPPPSQRVQRITEESRVERPGPVIDVRSHAPTKESPVGETSAIDSTRSDTPKAVASPGRQVNPAKRLMSSARELVFRRSAPVVGEAASNQMPGASTMAHPAPSESQQHPADASRGTQERVSLPDESPPETRQTPVVSGEGNPTPRRNAPATASAGPLSHTPGADGGSRPSTAERTVADVSPVSTLARVVRRSVSAVSRAPRMVFRKESTGSPHAAAESETGP